MDFRTIVIWFLIPLVRDICGANRHFGYEDEVILAQFNKDNIPPTDKLFWDLIPYFDNTTKRAYVTNVGQTAYLLCRVGNLGDRAVSWIRKRDLHILTVGILTYTNDQRFQSIHADGSEEWILKVTSPQIRDTGVYECQISTEPKISQGFQLNVVVSRAIILGNSELHVRFGSDINLTCIVTQTPDPPSFIYWYREGKLINYSQRGGINVVTEKQTRTSRLLISRAFPDDSGNYTCAPSAGEPASVFVHVLLGEEPAAMQHGAASRINNIPISYNILFLGLQSMFIACMLQREHVYSVP